MDSNDLLSLDNFLLPSTTVEEDRKRGVINALVNELSNSKEKHSNCKANCYPISGFLVIIYVQYWYTIANRYLELLNFVNRERQQSQAMIWFCMLFNT